MRKVSRRYGALFAFAIALAACVPAPSAATPAPVSTGPEAAEVSDKTVAQLQAVLQAQSDALIKRDLKAYQATYDQQRPAVRRCKQESFDVAARQGAVATRSRVIKVTPYLKTYARAWIDEPGFGISRQYFRWVDGTWVQSEPLEDELGGEKTMTLDGVGVDYWGIDEDVAQGLARGAVVARDAILSSALSEPLKDPYRIRFYPTRALAGLQACGTLGYHVTNAQQDKTIRFLRYWFEPDLKTVSAFTINVMEHEGLHWLQDEYSAGITARLEWWLTEGWPDYVAQSRSPAVIKSVVCTTKTPTMKELATGPRSDLPEWLPEDTGRYYAFANSMVEYLYAQYGGLTAYKQLVGAFKEGVDAKVNYPKILKTTPDDFYSGWLAFAKKKYC